MRYVLFIILIFATGCKSKDQQAVRKAPIPSTTAKEQSVDLPKNKTEEHAEQKELSFKNAKGEMIEKIIKTDEEWQKVLSEMEFYVIRKKGTERSHTSDLLPNRAKGIYACKACGLPLFPSRTKFKSGTGWPSFYQPVDETHILRDTDYNLGYERTEVMCRRCEGHLGHVFRDGPNPTGLRYCINGVSLKFEMSK